MQTISNSYIISSSGCTAAADNLHFDPEGYRVPGKRYAAKMLSLMGYEITDIGILEKGDYTLSQNFPNPFTNKTSISFVIPHYTFISLKVFSILGEEIAELAGKNYISGKHVIEFAPENLSQGNYLYMIRTDKFTSIREMVLLNE